MRRSFRIGLTACGAAALLLSGAALASHGKAGLWQITVTMGGQDASRMQSAMANVPPQYQAMMQAQMKAHGVAMGGNTITARQCMAANAWADGKPPPTGSHDKNCTMTHVSYTGSEMTADMTCTGTFVATGHVHYDWDSDEHFTGEVSITGTQNGTPVTHDEKFEGRFLSSQCGAAGH